MSAHSHDDNRVTIGCPACIEATRAAEAIARWEQAPLRAVTWRCSYDNGDDWDAEAELTFSLVVRVPPDATCWEVDERYADMTGEAFVMALPPEVAMDDTDLAVETMDVEAVTIGAEVVTEATPVVEHPSLFELSA